ncbi:MAG: hypothetical protein V3U27_15035 [Candidatus Tectomicrobia bacterium]
MDPTVDGNPISWTMQQLKNKLPDMLKDAGYDDLAGQVDQQALNQQLKGIASSARALFATGRNTVKHNRGTDIFEAGNFRFGLEMRKQAEIPPRPCRPPGPRPPGRRRGGWQGRLPLG